VSLTLSGLSESQASWSISPPVIAGGSGSAQLTVSTATSVAAGTYPLTITTTSGATVHSAPATLVVTAPPDFSLSAAPTSRNVVAGAGATYTAGVPSLDGFADDVALSLTGLPSGVGTASFSPQVIAGAGSSQLTVTTLPTAPGGTYPLTITGTAGGVTHTVAVTLVVSARDFALSVSPSSVTIFRSHSAKYTVGVSVVGGSAGNVSLTVAGLPTGATAVFSPNPVGSPGSSTLTVKPTTSTRRETYTLRITGTSGSLVHEPRRRSPSGRGRAPAGRSRTSLHHHRDHRRPARARVRLVAPDPAPDDSNQASWANQLGISGLSPDCVDETPMTASVRSSSCSLTEAWSHI